MSSCAAVARGARNANQIECPSQFQARFTPTQACFTLDARDRLVPSIPIQTSILRGRVCRGSEQTVFEFTCVRAVERHSEAKKTDANCWRWTPCDASTPLYLAARAFWTNARLQRSLEVHACASQWTLRRKGRLPRECNAGRIQYETGLGEPCSVGYEMRNLSGGRRTDSSTRRCVFNKVCV